MKNQKQLTAFFGIFLLSGAFLQGCTTSTGSNSSNSTSSSTADAANYKDGTYTESVSYTSPGGEQNISVQFALAGNIVTSVAVSPAGNDPMSDHYQTLFNTGIQQMVVGKNLNDLGSFGRVNGSSLTSMAFNQAVSQLKSEAKA